MGRLSHSLETRVGGGESGREVLNPPTGAGRWSGGCRRETTAWSPGGREERCFSWGTLGRKHWPCPAELKMLCGMAQKGSC